jgi:inositol-phosphate phosphatase/L-galactose 1-phosphate phosphatase/histidinol-phosphatase
VVNGAGGVITDWQGKELKEGWNGLVVAAATPALHQAALTVLNGY